MKRFLIAGLLTVALLGASSLRASVCDGSKVSAATAPANLSVDHYITDAALHRRWAVMVDCDHPERPWILLPASHLTEKIAPRPPHTPAKQVRVNFAVRAGDKVRLWRNADGASVDLSATALESGAVGQNIDVKTGQHGTVLEGQVRGAGSVELLAANRWQNKNAGRWSAQ